MGISIDRLNAVCRPLVETKLRDNVHNTGPLIARLFDKGTRKFTGSTYDIPITYAKNSNAKFYARAGGLGVAVVEDITKAQYDPVSADVGITLYGLDMALNKGDGAVIDMVDAELKIAEASLKELFGTDLFNTTQSNAILGLESICQADSGAGSTLGGIKGGPNGDATEWLSSSGTLGTANGPDSVTTALTKAVLDAEVNSCIVGNEFPTLIVTNPTIWSGIQTEYLMPNQFFADKKTADLGFESFTYRGIPVVMDVQAGTDLYVLNENYLYMAVVPGYDFKFIDFQEPVDYDDWTAHVRWYGQLVCGSRRHQGWMSALTSVT